MFIVKINWSGGKDSTAACYLHLAAGHKCKIVYYVPMFDDEIPLIQKDHYEFILRQAEEWKRLGAEVYRAEGISFWDYCHKITKVGKFKGMYFGFPVMRNKGMCSFKRDSKVYSLNKMDVGKFDYEDIGIAFDELENRGGQLTQKKRSILAESKYTEQMAKDLCISKNALSPHYKNATRDGCVLCANARCKELQIWFLDYPQARQRLLNLQEFCMRVRPCRYPLRDRQLYLDNENSYAEQISFFNEENNK